MELPWHPGAASCPTRTSGGKLSPETGTGLNVPPEVRKGQREGSRKRRIGREKDWFRGLVCGSSSEPVGRLLLARISLLPTLGLTYEDCRGG
eukprot:2890329-Rhodomonas_salina.2